MYLCSYSVSPIVSLSLPPCPSVSTFVEQLTLLTRLIPRSAHTGAVWATEAPTSQQVRAVSCNPARVPVAEVKRSHGVAWASAWVKRRPVRLVEQDANKADADAVTVRAAAVAASADVAGLVAGAVAGDITCAVDQIAAPTPCLQL